MRRRRGAGEIHQEAVFPVGRVPRQGVQVQRAGTGPGVRAIRPDVSFLGTDGRRVNLEVDKRADSSAAHRRAHLRAMQDAQKNYSNDPRLRRLRINPVQETRSVFVQTDGVGRVTRITKVSYGLDAGGQVFAHRPQEIRLRPPRTITSVLASDVLRTPPVLPSRAARRRFDAFAMV